jgi:arylsulfatase A-like enzyme
MPITLLTRNRIVISTRLPYLRLGFILLNFANSFAFQSDNIDRPNVIVVMTDDQGYGDIAAHGNKVIQTPNIDDFHEKSVRLTDFHVGPTCAPTRAGLLTGRYANRTGVWHTIGGVSILKEEEKTIANLFSENGYETGLFGKWHLGDNYPSRPQDKGFKHTVIHGGGGVGQTPDYWGNDYFDDTYLVNGKPQKFEGYTTDVWFDEAIKYIKKNRDRPFFCYISTNAPHSPYNVPQEYYEMYKDSNLLETQKRFYGMITNIDDNFQRLRDELQKLGLEKNTILIFMTDNGTAAGYEEYDGKLYGYNAGLRGVKNSEYDGGHRVPFFISYPNGKIGGGKDISNLSANVDILPTLGSLCNLDYSNYLVDGQD